MTTKLLAQTHTVYYLTVDQTSLAKPKGSAFYPHPGLSEYMQGNKFQILGVGTWTSLGAMILPTIVWVNKRSWGATWPQGLAEFMETGEILVSLRQ